MLDDEILAYSEVDIPDFNIAFEDIPEAEKERLIGNLDHNIDAEELERMKEEIGMDMAGMEASLDRLLEDMDDFLLDD